MMSTGWSLSVRAGIGESCKWTQPDVLRLLIDVMLVGESRELDLDLELELGLLEFQCRRRRKERKEAEKEEVEGST